MAVARLISDLFAGTCPILMFFAITRESILLCLVMAAALLVCCFGVDLAEARRGRITLFRELMPAARAPRALDRLAALGMTILAAGVGVYLVERAVDYDELWSPLLKDVSQIFPGFGFGLLSIVAWRAIPTAFVLARISRLAECRRLAIAFLWLGSIKAIYETVWLAGCALGCASAFTETKLLGIRVIDYGECSEWGVFCYIVPWTLMILTQLLLMRAIFRMTKVAASTTRRDLTTRQTQMRLPRTTVSGN